ncbi:MAG TPA: efflux RND transporter periplasmic adaptor subunit [Chloroflexota bacterium]|nr:efflux RND transporter periplasmic adaptor subunit [Chloroflexota bacterium]
MTERRGPASPSHRVDTEAAPSVNGARPGRALPPRPGRTGVSQATRMRAAILGMVLVVALAGTVWLVMAPGSAPPAAPTPAAQALTAHGLVQPIARATIGSINGGVVEQLPVAVGQTVEDKQLVARLNLQGQPELLSAPWHGVVTGVNVRLGDTVAPGASILTIADLSRYQVETTDVDEYLIGHIYPGQTVTMSVEALDQAQIDGVVKTVSLQQQQSASGANYPIVIDLGHQRPDLRPGMTVRITFLEPPS